ncbi:TPA: DNA phosphorothioation-dependent restriction protein DptH [Enterobacter ludwigii]
MLIQQFERLLVNEFISWVGDNVISGSRLQFKLSSPESRKVIYDFFIEKCSEEICISNVHIPYIAYKDKNIIPLLHSESGDHGFNQDYLAFLRDELQKKDYFKVSPIILFLHDTILDTITNSADDLTKNERVWSIPYFNKIMGGVCTESLNQNFYNILLEYQTDNMLEDNSSILSYKNLYECVYSGNFDLSKLGLFRDPTVELWENKKQIRNRIDENKTIHSLVKYQVDNFPGQLEDKLGGLFSSQFIKKHFDAENIDGWESLEFDLIKQDMDGNKKPNIEFITIETKSDVKIRTIDEGKTAGAKRRKHVVLEVPENLNKFDISIIFKGANIRDNEIGRDDVDGCIQDIIINNNGINRKITSTISIDKGVSFFSINTFKRDKTSDKFIFNFIVISNKNFYIDGFINNFIISPGNKIKLLTNDTTLIVNPDLENSVCFLDENIKKADIGQFGCIKFNKLIENNSDAEFIIKSGLDEITFIVEDFKADRNVVMPLIFDKDKERKLLDDNYYGIYDLQSKKILIDNRTVEPEEQDLKLLDYEKLFLNEGIIGICGCKKELLSSLQASDENLFLGYKELYDYLSKRNAVLSLVSWGEELRSIVSKLVKDYIHFIDNIPYGIILSEAQKNVIKIGIIEDENEFLISPLHPLNLAYFLELTNQIALDNEKSQDETSSFYSMPSITFKRLNIRGMMPFVFNNNNGFAYVTPLENNCSWLKALPHSISEYDYVPKLVKDKINEFEIAFGELFKEDGTLIINAINQNHSKEFFKGVVKYFKQHIELPNVLSIHINFYDDKFIYNTFDVFSELNELEPLCSLLDLKSKKEKDSVYSLTDMLRSNITYNKYENSIENASYNYAHLSFFNNDNKISCVNVRVGDQPSGLCANGLICSEASQSENGSYFTSFGLQGVEAEAVPHLHLAKLYSSLITPTWKENCKYNGSETLAIAVSSDFKSTLKKIYESSIWTVIIDPKVTLDFFTNQDMLLIHFSDNYTHSAGYDAVTVSQSENLFAKLLNSGKGSKISEFNAFNGKWLLQLLTSTEKSRKGLEGEVAAYKLATSVLRKNGVTWIPISIGETIRASKNIGLKLDDVEMSVANGNIIGPISDDILMVGFDGKILQFVPLEVKTGRGADYKKALTQVKALAKHFNGIFSSDDLKSIIYKSLFARQLISQVEKYNLYEIFPEGYFNNIFDSKEYLLSGKYILDELCSYEGMIISHVDNDYIFNAKCNVDEKILLIELPSMINQLISKPLSELFDSVFLTTHCGIPPKFLSCNQLHNDSGSFLEDMYTNSQNENDVFLKYNEENITNSTIDSIPQNTGGNINYSQLLASDLPKNEEHEINKSIIINLGKDIQSGEKVLWEIENTLSTMNTNTGIIGTMGTGKTQFTKSLITQLTNNDVGNSQLSILIFDYKSDYIDDEFVNINKGRKYKPYRLPYNPLSLYGEIPLLPVHTARVFSETLGKAFNLGVKQQLKLRKVIAEAYEMRGVNKADQSTWSNLPPTLYDIWALYLEKDPEQDSLYAALESLADLEVFESDATKCLSLFDFISNVTIIELAQYPSQIQSLVVALTLDQFYSQMQKSPKPQVKENFRRLSKMILVDEADNFMSENYDSLRKILKEGREYGVGMILSTQDITHFQTGDNDYSNYILTWFVHKVSKIKNQDIKAIFNVGDKISQDSLMGSINTLETHHCLYVDGKKDIIKLNDFAFWMLLNEL